MFNNTNTSSHINSYIFSLVFIFSCKDNEVVVKEVSDSLLTSLVESFFISL